MISRVATSTIFISLLASCSSMSPSMYSQTDLPAAVQAPAGNKVAMEMVGVGTITYKCSAKKDMSEQFEWVFVGPDAKLNDRNGKQLGKYYGPPATWESMDGSKLTGTQVAIAPASAGSIPNQLVKANPASGAMGGVTYIQRVKTMGGVAPTTTCAANNMGAEQVVKYQADYIFYKTAI